MIINKSSMYSPKKATPKPVAPPRPNIVNNQNMMQPRNINNNQLVAQPRNVVKPDKIISNNPINNMNELSLFEDDFFFPFNEIQRSINEMFNETSLKELAKTNDVNHEKWTKVSDDGNSVVHFESFTITSKKK